MTEPTDKEKLYDEHYLAIKMTLLVLWILVYVFFVSRYVPDAFFPHVGVIGMYLIWALYHPSAGMGYLKKNMKKVHIIYASILLVSLGLATLAV